MTRGRFVVFEGGDGSGSGSDEAGNGVARPRHEGEEHNQGDKLNRGRKTEPAKLGAIVHEKVAVPE